MDAAALKRANEIQEVLTKINKALEEIDKIDHSETHLKKKIYFDVKNVNQGTAAYLTKLIPINMQKQLQSLIQDSLLTRALLLEKELKSL